MAAILDSYEVAKWPYGSFESMVVMPGLDWSHLPGAEALQGTRPASEARKPRASGLETMGGRALKGHYISNTDRGKGFTSEKAFAEALERHGFQVYTLPHFEANYKRHIDFEVSTSTDDGSEACFWVDVKSPKALRKASAQAASRADPMSQPQDRYVCLQLTANGDMHGSEADYLAFGLTTGQFLVADRHKIIECVNRHLVTTEGQSAWPETSLWRPYVRTYHGVSLVMCYMDLKDLSDAIVCVV